MSRPPTCSVGEIIYPQRKRSAKVSFKLSVIRSFFEYLKSTRVVQKIVKQWDDYPRIDDLSPYDLRRSVITKALDGDLTYRQVQVMLKHKYPKTAMRYDHGREESRSEHCQCPEV